MRKKTRNCLLEILRRDEIDPLIFEVSETQVDSWECFKLSLANGAHYFVLKERFIRSVWQFGWEYTNFIIDYPEPRFGKVSGGASVNLGNIIQFFEGWLPQIREYFRYLEEVAEERDAPDLWAELQSSVSQSTDSQRIENIPFSSDEQDRIRETLTALESEIKNREILSPEQANLLHEGVEYLVESSKRLGRKDWLAATVGALVGFTLQAGLTSDTATQIIHLAGEALRWIAHTPLLLPR